MAKLSTATTLLKSMELLIDEGLINKNPPYALARTVSALIFFIVSLSYDCPASM